MTEISDLVNTTYYLIDLCSKNAHLPPLRWATTDDAEARRYWALAATHYETALMWASKAASYSKVPADVVTVAMIARAALDKDTGQ